jgi:Ca2+-binding EF-hand superfamily protein
MSRMLGILLAGLTLCFIMTGAQAQGKKLDVEAAFKKLDANSDGKLSKDEFLKLADRFKDKDKAREKLTKAFEKIDPQNQGLSKDQFGQYLDSVKKKDATP